jgi:hypothetical protein
VAGREQLVGLTSTSSGGGDVSIAVDSLSLVSSVGSASASRGAVTTFSGSTPSPDNNGAVAVDRSVTIPGLSAALSFISSNSRQAFPAVELSLKTLDACRSLKGQVGFSNARRGPSNWITWTAMIAQPLHGVRWSPTWQQFCFPPLGLCDVNDVASGSRVTRHFYEIVMMDVTDPRERHERSSVSRTRGHAADPGERRRG